MAKDKGFNIEYAKKMYLRNAESILEELYEEDKILEIKLINNIEEQINKYKKKTGVTKSFIAKKMGFKKIQNLDSLCDSANPTISNLIKLSIILKCDILDLIDYEVII